MSNFVTNQTPSDVANILGITIDEAIQLLMVGSGTSYNAVMKVTENEEYMSGILDMPIKEYREHVTREIEFVTTKASADRIEDKHLIDTTYTTEKEFIDFNLSDIQDFMWIPRDIKPMGKYSSQILEDHLYRGIPRISRDVVNEIIKNFKIIDIQDVYDRFSKQFTQTYDRDSDVDGDSDDDLPELENE